MTHPEWQGHQPVEKYRSLLVPVNSINWSGNEGPKFRARHTGGTLLLDDHGPYVHPEQEHLRVEVPLFESPYPAEDDGLKVALKRLRERINALGE